MDGNNYAYSVDDSAREHLVPNLRIVASQPFMGLTAYIGDEPHLVIGRESDNTYLMEDQFGQRKIVDFVFPWEMPKVESNKLVAASRIEESPFSTVGLLYYDEETGEWAVRVGSSNMAFPLEDKIASLEEKGWSKFADGAESTGLDLGGMGTPGPATEEHPGAGHNEPTIEVRAACPHCHSDQHLELASDDHHPHSDEKKYVCHNCGKWSHEHELEVSDHDKDGQDQNPEDVNYEEHDDDAERHQEPETEKEVHDDSHKFDLVEDIVKKKKHSSTAFTIQGVTFNAGKSAKGQAIKPEEQGTQAALNTIKNLPTAFDHEKDYVKRRYQEQGFPAEYHYDNPFINRGGSIVTGESIRDRLRRIDPKHLPNNWEDLEGLDQAYTPNNLRVPQQGNPSSPEHFSADNAILCVNELTPDDFELFSNPAVSGVLLSRGGPGSHAVYVATTMGLACVLIKPEEYERIQVGDMLNVDGSTGVIHVNGGTSDFIPRSQDEVRNEAEYDMYRFAYANGQGHVEQMKEGQFVGDLGGHMGMIGMLMESGHAQVDPTTYDHNATYGFFTNKGTIVQDLKEIPDQEAFENWAHTEESALGLPQGQVRRENISAYGVSGAPAAEPAASAAPAPAADGGMDQMQSKVAAAVQMAYPGGQGIHNGTSAAFQQEGLHATVTAEGLPQPITLPFSAPNMFIMIKMFQMQGLLAPGTPITVESDNPQLAEQIIQQQSGAVAKVAYEDEKEPHSDKLGPLICTHCGSHTVEALSLDEDEDNAEFLCHTCGNTFNAKYRKSAAAKHPKGTRVELTHPAKKGIKGSITDDDAGTDDNFGDSLYNLILDNGDELSKVPEIHFKKIKSASILVIAALHDEVAEYASMMAHATDQDPDEIVSDLASKGMIHSDEEWTEALAVINHVRGQNANQLNAPGVQPAASTHESAGPADPSQLQQQGNTPPCPHCGNPTTGTPNYYWCPSCGWTSQSSQVPGGAPGVPGAAPQTAPMAAPAQTFHSNVKSAALSVGEWYTMYSPDYKVPDVIQVVDVNDLGVTANIEGDDKGLFPISLPHSEIEAAGYRFEPYSNPSKVIEAKVARRDFSATEQNELVNENLEGLARNFHKLNLEDTHYPQEIEASVDPLNEEFYLW